MKKLLLTCVLVFGSVLAHAEDSSKLRFVGRLGMGFGSAPLDSGFYVGGGAWELSSGNGLKYALGADYRIAQNVTIQATVGKELSTVPAGNGDLTFYRTPVELLALFDISKDIRLGAGLRQSTNSEVSSSGAGAGYPSVGNWTASTGTVLEAQYVLASRLTSGGGVSQFGVSLRFVSENFSKGAVSKNADHSEIGIFLYY